MEENSYLPRNEYTKKWSAIQISMCFLCDDKWENIITSSSTVLTPKKDGEHELMRWRIGLQQQIEKKFRGRNAWRGLHLMLWGSQCDTFEMEWARAHNDDKKSWKEVWKRIKMNCKMVFNAEKFKDELLNTFACLIKDLHWHPSIAKVHNIAALYCHY